MPMDFSRSCQRPCMPVKPALLRFHYPMDMNSQRRNAYPFICESSISTLLGATVISLRADPGSGDVFREYSWSNKGNWQRITAPDATSEAAKKVNLSPPLST